MPGPNRAPRGGYAKPKNMAKTIRRLVGYLTKSKLPLVAVFLFLMLSVFTNLGGSYMMRDIINSFIWSGCTDFAGLALSRRLSDRLCGPLLPVRRHGPAGPEGRQPAEKRPV